MTTENANPSLDPADNDTLVGLLRLFETKLKQNFHCALPATVVAFDRDSQRAQVQPGINVTVTDGQQVNRAQIPSVPVVQMGGGDFLISFDLEKGNTGLLIVCDRDISLFLQSQETSKASTNRTHDLADSFFIPCVLWGYSLSSQDIGKMVIQSRDGNTKMSIGTEYIKIVTPLLAVEGNITASGDITPGTPPPL
jgi:hypothetical protein